MMKSILISLTTLALTTTLACTKHETPVSATAQKTSSSRTASSKAQPHASATASETESARTDVGDLMPAYSATFLDGKPLSLSNEKGNVVFLNVWATWCGPCRFETPELQALQNQYAASGLKVIGVSVDEGDDEAVKTFVAEQKITYPIAVDPEGRIATLVQTTVLPTSLLIDRNGKIVWRQIGAIMPNDAKLKAAVEKAVGDKRG
jgi:thiol-disulfide isomerase/thioredoxin